MCELITFLYIVCDKRFMKNVICFIYLKHQAKKVIIKGYKRIC